jgi:hypothetical protein
VAADKTTRACHQDLLRHLKSFSSFRTDQTLHARQPATPPAAATMVSLSQSIRHFRNPTRLATQSYTHAVSNRVATPDFLSKLTDFPKGFKLWSR